MARDEAVYLRMRRYLLDLIERNRDTPEYKLPSENQLARNFGASRIAAKHAFDTLAAEGTIVRQQGRGSFASGAPERPPAPRAIQGEGVALIAPTIRGAFMSDLIEGARAVLAAKGLRLTIFLPGSDAEDETRCLREAKAKYLGALFFPGAYARYQSELLHLVLDKFPLVQIDRYLPGLDLSCVACDHFAAAAQAVRYLRARGHTRIGYVGHSQSHATSTAERAAGFEAAITEIDPSYASLFRFLEARAGTNLDAALAAYFDRTRPTAIIGTSYRHGPALVRLLRARGLEESVELMLFDDEFRAAREFLGIHPFVIDQQPAKIGEAAAQLVYEMACQGAEPRQVRLQARIERL